MCLFLNNILNGSAQLLFIVTYTNSHPIRQKRVGGGGGGGGVAIDMALT